MGGPRRPLGVGHGLDTGPSLTCTYTLSEYDGCLLDSHPSAGGPVLRERVL